VVAIVAAVLLGVAFDRWLRSTTTASIPPLRNPATALFAASIPIAVTVSAAGQHAPWIATEEELRHSTELWKRMHLQDWNGVPPTLRAEGLDNMLRHYSGILNDPAAWDSMNAFDWDAVPQPVRTVAYRRMIAYWSGFYHVGSAFNLPAGRVSETLAAIVMSESWFDHRARSVNRDGTLDVGLGQASFFARQRLRELHASGRVDATLAEDDYDNPWMATRFVALWMNLMLEESNGDLERAVRAYNRGITDAQDRWGAEYFTTVQRRLSQYIWNVGAPASWDYVWRHAREMVGRAYLVRACTSADVCAEQHQSRAYDAEREQPADDAHRNRARQAAVVERLSHPDHHCCDHPRHYHHEHQGGSRAHRCERDKDARSQRITEHPQQLPQVAARLALGHRHGA
jgi:hypothetical protein